VCRPARIIAHIQAIIMLKSLIRLFGKSDCWLALATRKTWLGMLACRLCPRCGLSVSQVKKCVSVLKGLACLYTPAINAGATYKQGDGTSRLGALCTVQGRSGESSTYSKPIICR
jgi:hypothetical protein